jgi:hypothetical protein
MDGFQLPSGTKIDALYGIVGINADLEISSGYDDGVHIEGAKYGVELPPEVQVELADYMIRRWQQYRERAQSKESCNICGAEGCDL